MTKEHEIFDEEDKMILEVFPFPKWIRLFNYFFPKTENYKSINWRKYLKVWVRWSPLLTFFLLILILVIGGIRPYDFVSFFTVIIFALCTLRTIYLFGIALIAKCFKRSTMTPLALAPIAPIIGIGVVLIIVFCDWAFCDSEPSKKSKSNQVKTVVKEIKDNDPISQEKNSSTNRADDSAQEEASFPEERRACKPYIVFL